MGLLNPNHNNSQVSEAYSMKGSKKVSNHSFQKGNTYVNTNSQSPSQTFFKESKKQGNGQMAGKKVLPPFSNAKKAKINKKQQQSQMATTTNATTHHNSSMNHHNSGSNSQTL